jgi:phenylpropionate dioxygenase-like ring-hydroxylating dioxygenase large terminal subunit
MATDLNDLFDSDTGTVSPSIYVDDEIYRLELEQVFGRCWLYLAHESQLPKAGSWVSAYMGEDPVIVVRQRDGAVKALLNQCRHRGMRVCRADFGKNKNFMCPYHGWTYGMDGALVNVPGEKGAYHGEIDKSAWGLRSVARVESYKGFIFATWDSEAPRLFDYLGDFRWYFDSVADRSEAGLEVIGGTHRWVIPANWKLAAEQFASDMYHAAISHASAFVSMVPEGEAAEAAAAASGARGRQFSSELGHGIGFYTDGDPSTSLVLGKEAAAWNESNPAVVDRLGAPRGENMRVGHGTIFPNFSFLTGVKTMRVWHPRGPGEMEVWAWVLVDKDAPPEVKEAHRVGVSRTFSPAGIFEQDDGENWAEIQRILSGSQARRGRLNVQMGKGHEFEDPEYPGRINRVYSETAARSFYAHWLRLLSGATWNDLVSVDLPEGVAQ